MHSQLWEASVRGEAQVSLGKLRVSGLPEPIASLPSLCRCLWTWTRWTRCNPWPAHSVPWGPGRALGSPGHCWASHGTCWCWHTSVGKWSSRSRRWWHRGELAARGREKNTHEWSLNMTQESQTCPKWASGQSGLLQSRRSWPSQEKLSPGDSGVGPRERVSKCQATRRDLWEAERGWMSWHDWGQNQDTESNVGRWQDSWTASHILLVTTSLSHAWSHQLNVFLYALYLPKSKDWSCSVVSDSLRPHGL